MKDAVIVEAVRTPIGKRNGGLSGVHPADLSATVLQGLVDRTGLDPALVEDVIWGCVSQVGEQSMNVGRYGVLAAGWPESVPSTTVDRQCGSSQQAAAFAAAGVMAGHYDIVVAGGVESMSRVQMFSSVENGPGHPQSPLVTARYGDQLVPQGIGAEMIAEKWGLNRERLDSIAVRSHERAAAAIDAGRFAGQIVPVTTPEGVVVDTDEGVRRGTTLETLAKLKTPFQENGRVTAGNASQISDGAAALLIMTAEKARDLGLTPIARFVSSAVVGVDPITMLTGPIPATRKILDRSGIPLSEIGVFEVNEAFASVIGAWEDEIGPDTDKVNPNGGAIALGHPLGGSGARVMTTMLHHMRDNDIQYGLQAICEGGGMANATILELLR
ncbi:thiolase family protein [Aeromicrobium chenweiae]|uniref:Acetyl-CoA C-acetyltransferase n=1 Tax=Aeromicrobium chenweiae TaxID=2079793 RepID=A0A2S0WIU4_9ACTN|nr:thiolase family protein [Aeromicrobium chenweiae]AWB91258.1 acetyl-CoA C-acetyltransferase [Aeromicrobium chenweiae]TGN31776.1 thiolase family protein [Aeromicrobium chenweiae]